jgi:glycolate oxidase iron-sulfur subunit
VTAQPRFLDERKSLACIHCGLCLGACPTYLQTGNENESPRGRIYLMRALQDGRLPLEAASVRHIDLCLGCRACEVACPSGVEYGALLEQTRDFIEARHRRPPWQKFLRRVVIERIFPVPGRLRLALAPARLLQRIGLDRFLPASLQEPIRLIPPNPTADQTPEFSPAAVQPAKGAVGFIRGCAMSVMFGQTNAASVRLLNLAGYDVVAPHAQGCCGALFAHSGRLDLAREAARRNVAAFKIQKLNAIIINAAGCGSTLKEYAHFLPADPSAASFGAQVRDLTEFLVQSGFLEAKFRPSNEKVTYHDACHLAHAQRIVHPPRQLVRAVAGSHYVELSEAEICCGSAGTYNLTEPEMAAALQRRKIANIVATGARTVVTTNPGCILQIQAGLQKAAGHTVRVMHIADYLAEALPG